MLFRRQVIGTTLLSPIILLLTTAGPVWAVQAHGGAEGLVSHQIGHVLFTLGMGYLLFRLYAMPLRGPDWAQFKTFLWLLIAWNSMTFSGHWINEFVTADKFVRHGSSILSFAAETPSDVIYYLSQLDHLILVPAFVFLFLSLRNWRQQP